MEKEGERIFGKSSSSNFPKAQHAGFHGLSFVIGQSSAESLLYILSAGARINVSGIAQKFGYTLKSDQLGFLPNMGSDYPDHLPESIPVDFFFSFGKGPVDIEANENSL
jgi:hypothetical protein